MLVLSLAGAQLSVSHDATRAMYLPYCPSPRCKKLLKVSDHFVTQRNTPLTEPRYRFDKTNDDLLHNTLKDSLTNIDTNITTQVELEELAVTLCGKLMKAVDKSTPKVYSRNDPKSPVSHAILDLIKEKRRLRQLYNNTQDPNIKSTINRLQKEIRTKINHESTIS